MEYAAHQLNLWPRVSLPETSPTLCWTVEVGDASVFRLDPLPGTVPVKVAVDPCAARGAASGGAKPGGAESEGAGSGCAKPGGAEPTGVERGDAEPEGVEPGGAEYEGAESGDAEPRGTASSGDPAILRHDYLPCRSLSPRSSCASGIGAGGVGATSLGGAGVTAGACSTGVLGALELEELLLETLKPRGTGAGGTGVGGVGAGGVGGGAPGAVGAGGTVRPRPYFIPLLQQVLRLPSSAGLTPPLLCPLPDQSQPPLQPASPLPAPSPWTEYTRGLIERRKPKSRPASPVRAVRTGRRVPRPRPPPFPGTHIIALRPSSVPLRVPLMPPFESSLPAVPDPESDLAHAASPTVSRLLATVVTDPSFESTAASALFAELVDISAACRLDYATALVAESGSASPLSVEGECALGTDVTS
ncbi:unnamed protein product [Closterium sp. NIES-54]